MECLVLTTLARKQSISSVGRWLETHSPEIGSVQLALCLGTGTRGPTRKRSETAYKMPHKANVHSQIRLITGNKRYHEPNPAQLVRP